MAYKPFADKSFWEDLLKEAPPTTKPETKEAAALLKAALERFRTKKQAMAKTASDKDYSELFQLHHGVHAAYGEAVRSGRRTEANKALDGFEGWEYLKGMPQG